MMVSGSGSFKNGDRVLPGDNGDIGAMRSPTFDREVEAMYFGGAPVGGKIFHFSSVFLGKFRTGFMNVEAYVPDK